MHATEVEAQALQGLLRLGDLVVPMALRTASSLGLAEHLGQGPMSAELLAERLSLRCEPLIRLLRVLAHAGVVERLESGEFCLGDLGRVLRRDHPLCMRDAFTVAATDVRAWTQLEHAIRTGSSGFERAYGEAHGSYVAHHLEEDIRMDRAHQAATRLDLLTLARAYPWGEVRTLVDVGGGTGTFLAGLLRRHPGMHGTLFDLPRMVANAPAIIQSAGVDGRCRVVAGDFLESVPAGGDVYVLKAVLGAWDDASCVRILKSVHAAMHAGSMLLIIEPVMGLGPEFSLGNRVQLHTLVLYGGKFRSFVDYGPLVAAANLGVRRVVPRATLSIIELARS